MRRDHSKAACRTIAALIWLAAGGPTKATAQDEGQAIEPGRSVPRQELDLRHRGGRHSTVDRDEAIPGDRLVVAIARSVRTTWYDQGVQASIEAVVACQKGDHPGGGMGLLSIATMRPSAPSDHCRRL
jgi:hypothetical protein